MATTTAVLNAAGEFIKTITSAAEKEEFKDQEVSYVTRKTFEPTDKYASFDEMIGKVQKVDESAAQAEKPARAPTVALTGPYHLRKPLPPVAEDHPKKPIWDAIVANDGNTCEAAKEACPKEAPKRRTSGTYSFNSEFRYFLKTGYVALGDKPEGFDHQAEAAKKAEGAAAKKASKSKAKKEASEGEQAQAAA